MRRPLLLWTFSCVNLLLGLFLCGPVEAAKRENAPPDPSEVVTASSAYASEYLPERAFDGNLKTRWASGGRRASRNGCKSTSAARSN